MSVHRTDSKNFCVQDSVHPAMQVGTYGASTLTYAPRGIQSNTTRHYKLTFMNGTYATLLLNAGLTYPYSVKTVATSGATAISSTSALVFYFY